jgi:oligopeptide transport system substrate-binding protein
VLQQEDAMRTRLLVMLLVAGGLALVAAWAVAAHEPTRESGSIEATGPTLRLNLGPADPTIDPALASDPGLLVVNALFLGLTRTADETGAAVPELATSWAMSPDARVFTFTLRTGVTWTDGNPVTAHDVRYGILRSLEPATACDLAYMLYPIQNAEEYNSGAITDPRQVGVKVLDYTHLRFDLQTAAAYLPNVLAMPPARAMPAWTIDEHSKDWTEPTHIVSNGSYKLTAWTHGTSLILEKNPGYYDAADVQIGRVIFSMVDDATAWGMYQAGQLDSVVVPQSEWNAARRDPSLAPQLHAASHQGTYYYGFNLSKAPFDILLVRKAFIAATDRLGLVELVTSRSDATAYAAQGLPLALTFTPPGVWGHVDGSTAGVGIPYDPSQARQWLAAAGYPNGDGLPPITLAYNAHPVHQAVAEYLRQKWTDNLSVTVALSPTAVFNPDYQDLLCSDAPQVWRMSWIADQRDGYNLLYTAVNWRCERAPYGNWTNPSYESLLRLAAQTADPNARKALYQQAEEILVETDAVMLPLFYFGYEMATKPYLQRTYSFGVGGRIADWRITWRAFLPLTYRSDAPASARLDLGSARPNAWIP